MRLKNPEVTCQELIWGDDKEPMKYQKMGGTQMVENKNLNKLRDELEKAKREKLQAEHQLQRKKN